MSCVYCHSLWISFIKQVPQGAHVVVALGAVHAVIDGDKADVLLGKGDLTDMDKTTKSNCETDC